MSFLLVLFLFSKPLHNLNSHFLSNIPQLIYNALIYTAGLHHQQASNADTETFSFVSPLLLNQAVHIESNSVARSPNTETAPPVSDDPSKFRQRDDTSFGFDNLSDSIFFEDGVHRYDKYYSMSQRYVKHLSSKYRKNAIQYLPPILIDWHNVDSP